MREFDLPSPSIGGMGHHLRRIAAKGISYIQINAPAFGGTHPNASHLRAFFAACADALAPYDASPGTEGDTSPAKTPK